MSFIYIAFHLSQIRFIIHCLHIQRPFLGTPGVGKSTLSRILAEKTKYAWREVSKLAEEYNCLDEYDPEYQCPFLNEDKVSIVKVSVSKDIIKCDMILYCKVWNC